MVKRTLDVLTTDVVEKCGGLIHEKDLQGLIDKVYPCWEEQQRKEYEVTYRNLSQGILYELSPLASSTKREKDYYDQFDGVKVLPSCLCERYQYYFEQQRLVKADSLLVSIRESRMYALLREDGIERFRVVCAGETLEESEKAGQCAKLFQKSVMKVKRMYDSELGLQWQWFDDCNDTFM